MSETNAPIETTPVDIAPQEGAVQNDAPKTEQPTEQKEPGWYARRLGQITYERRQAERDRDAAREEAENYRRALSDARGEPKQEESRPQPTEADIRSKIEKEGVEQEFNKRCNDVADKIRQTHGEDGLKRATDYLHERAGFDMKKHRDVLDDITGLPNASEVYYALAHDPDAASEILNAPSRRQFALLSRFADGLASKSRPPEERAEAESAPVREVSKAPPPVRSPRGGSSSSTGSIFEPGISAEEFERRWAKGKRD